MRSLHALAAFTLVYLVGFTVYALARGDDEFLFYAVVMGILVGLVVVLHTRARFGLGVLWGLSLWGLAHMAGGTVPVPGSLVAAGEPPVLYNLRPWEWLPKYDQVVHAYGFGVATVAAWQALRAAADVRPSAGVLTGIVCIGMGLGALNEVVEFGATRLLASTNVGGYANTGWDLVANLVGCVAAAGLVRWSWGRARERR